MSFLMLKVERRFKKSPLKIVDKLDRSGYESKSLKKKNNEMYFKNCMF